MILSTFLVILAYLMGSICSAVIVCKIFSLPDPRSEGSKNPGATNVLRLAGKKYATLVLVADLLKGTIPVVIARMFEADAVTVAFTALAAVIGHMYPVFFEFKGGKGVATAIGALLGFQFIVGVMVAGTWLLVAKFSRFSSLASIVSICLAPFYSLMLIGRIDIFPPLFFMALLILLKHKTNIARLIDGTEPHIKLKKKNILDEVMGDKPSGAASLDKHPTVESVVAKPATEAKKDKTLTKKNAKTEKPLKKTTSVKTKTKKADKE